jgi:hypothetical protein
MSSLLTATYECMVQRAGRAPQAFHKIRPAAFPHGQRLQRQPAIPGVERFDESTLPRTRQPQEPERRGTPRVAFQCLGERIAASSSRPLREQHRPSAEVRGRVVGNARTASSAVRRACANSREQGLLRVGDQHGEVVHRGRFYGLVGGFFQHDNTRSRQAEECPRDVKFRAAEPLGELPDIVLTVDGGQDLPLEREQVEDAPVLIR